MSAAVPSFRGNINFNAQHAPMGSFMSFTCGHFGTGGGIGVELGKPANQNVYIGIKQGGRRSSNPIRCLPFVRGSASSAAAAADFQVEQAPTTTLPPSVDCYAQREIQRHFGWATDTWATQDFSFTLYTPFGSIPQPTGGADDHGSLRDALLPAVVATLTIDNRAGDDTKTAIFALDFDGCGTRLLANGDDNSRDVGFAWRRHMGVLARTADRNPSTQAFTFQRWSVAEGLADVNPVHELGSCAGVGVEVPAGESRTLVLAIGCYLDGIATTGLEGRYYYTRLYNSLEDVLSTALDRAADLREQSAKLDARLLASHLSSDQQFLIAHGTRGYYGSTQLLEVGGEPTFVVNEGEYCMMNTLDLSIDHVFWELQYNPWVVRNILDQFSRRYSYHDQVRTRGGELLPGGVSFCHDMGANNNFSRPGHSSYELAHLTGCFSYMTQEELCNWILLACCYVAHSGDEAWLTDNAHLLAACAESMRNRAHQRTGLMAYDSGRCEGGQEITTYDSLDESLGQARANTYLATKCWASWVGLEMLDRLRTAGDLDGSTTETLTDPLAQYLAASAGADGTIPAVLEKDNPGYHSRILPVIESLIYPAFWLNCLTARQRDRNDQAIDLLNGVLAGPLVDVLRRHVLALLNDPQRRNLFADGGIKLSSTSNNSWMSKIAIVQHVAKAILRLDAIDSRVDEIFRTADAAHVRWQTQGSGFWACSDQFVKGIAKASRYYPRIITTALWLDGAPQFKPPTADTVVPTPKVKVKVTIPSSRQEARL